MAVAGWCDGKRRVYAGTRSHVCALYTGKRRVLPPFYQYVSAFWISASAEQYDHAVSDRMEPGTGDGNHSLPADLSDQRSCRQCAVGLPGPSHGRTCGLCRGFGSDLRDHRRSAICGDPESGKGPQYLRTGHGDHDPSQPLLWLRQCRCGQCRPPGRTGCRFPVRAAAVSEAEP